MPERLFNRVIYILRRDAHESKFISRHDDAKVQVAIALSAIISFCETR